MMMMNDKNINDSSYRNNKPKHREKKVLWLKSTFCKLFTVNIG